MQSWDDISYQSLNEAGYTIFKPMIRRSLDIGLQYDSEDEAPHFVTVLWVESSKDLALILMTENTARRCRKELQRVHTLLGSTHRFAKVKRIYADKRTVESFVEASKDVEENETDISSNVSESANFTKFKEMVAMAVEKKASDIHYYVYANKAKYDFRIDGRLSHTQELYVLEAREMLSAAINSNGIGVQGLEDDSKPYDIPIVLMVDVNDGDGGIKQESVKLRLSRRGLNGQDGYKATMRVNILSNQSLDLANLNYPSEQEQLLSKALHAPYGLFLATGPVGSGKSTTTSAMIEMFPKDLGGMTIEDPVEFTIRHEQITQFQVNESDKSMTLNALLKNSLRQDPNLCSVAEIRDEEVAELVFKYSNVGTVMVSTIHTNEAIYAFQRLFDLKIGLNELSAPDTFLGVLNQRLLRKLCSHCKTPKELGELENVYVSSGTGCSKCTNGFVGGRTAVAELLIPTAEDTPFIMDRAWKAWRDDLISRGFITLAIRAYLMSKEGKICWNDVLQEIPHASIVHEHLRLSQVSALQTNISG